MTRAITQIALVGLAVVFYVADATFWSSMCVLAAMWLSFRKWITLIAKFVDKLARAHEEGANSAVSYSFNIERVLEHPAVDKLFTQLAERGKAPAGSVEQWRQLLLASYSRKYKRQDGGCEVSWNVKNQLLFKDGKVDFGDVIYHSIEIPYKWTETGEPEEKHYFHPEIEAQLTIRCLMLNGHLILQVGSFSKEYSPRILRGGSLAIYQTFATITSFPLMYFSFMHGMPARYLNLVAGATESYKEAGADVAHGKDRYKDWKALNADVATYRVLLDNDDDIFDTWRKANEAFAAKRKPMLETDGYKDLFPPDEDDSWRYPDSGHTYGNRYGRVFFQNLNMNREDSRVQRNWFSDYYEELP